MEKTKKQIYNSPSINGVKHFVPIVVKNRDYLVGYIDGINQISQDISDTSHISKALNLLSSIRFNDIIDDKGTRVSRLDDKQVNDLLDEKELALTEYYLNPENEPTILDVKYLGVSCVCGNYYSFNNRVEIPVESFKCGLCDRVIIDYTNKDDYEFDFDVK